MDSIVTRSAGRTLPRHVISGLQLHDTPDSQADSEYSGNLGKTNKKNKKNKNKKEEKKLRRTQVVEEKVKLGDHPSRRAGGSTALYRLEGQNSAVRMSCKRSAMTTPTDWGKRGSSRRCARTGGGISTVEMLWRTDFEKPDMHVVNQKWDHQPGFVKDKGDYTRGPRRMPGWSTTVKAITTSRPILPPPGFCYVRQGSPKMEIGNRWPRLQRVDDRRRRMRRAHLEEIERMNEEFYASVNLENDACYRIDENRARDRAKVKFLTSYDTAPNVHSTADMYYSSLLSPHGLRAREAGNLPPISASDRRAFERAVDYIKRDVLAEYVAHADGLDYENPNIATETYDIGHYEDALLEAGEPPQPELFVEHYEETADSPEKWDVVRESVHLAISGFLISLESLGGTWRDLAPMLRDVNAAVLGLCSARHWSGVAVNVLQLLKTVAVEIDLEAAMNYLRSGTTPEVQGKVLDDFSKMLVADDDDDMPWWASATEIVQVLINAPIGQRVIKFLSQIIALKIVSRESLKFQVWGMAMFDVPEASGCVSIANAIDMFISILRRAHKVIIQCFSEQSMTPLAYDDIDIPKFDKAFLMIHNMGKSLKQGNLETVHDVTEDEFENMLCQTEKLGAKMLAKKTNGMVKELIMKKVAQLSDVRSEFELYTRAKGIKPLDYLITLYGPTGCGKTVMAYPLMQSMLAYNGLPHTRDRIATLQESDAYDTLAKSNVLCYYLDDLANFKLKNGQSPAQMIIRLVNTARNPAIKADVDEKGKVFFNHAFTLITTNVEMFDIKDVANCESSILRRQAVTVLVLPRPHLCLGDSVIMDPHLQRLHIEVFGSNKGLMQNFQWFTPRRVVVSRSKVKNREDTTYIPARITKEEYPKTYKAIVAMSRSLMQYYFNLALRFPQTIGNVYDHFGLGPDARSPYSAQVAHVQLFKITDHEATLNTVDLTVFMTFVREDTAIHRKREVEVSNKQMDTDNYGWCKLCDHPMATCVCGNEVPVIPEQELDRQWREELLPRRTSFPNEKIVEVNSPGLDESVADLPNPGPVWLEAGSLEEKKVIVTSSSDAKTSFEYVGDDGSRDDASYSQAAWSGWNSYVPGEIEIRPMSPWLEQFAYYKALGQAKMVDFQWWLQDHVHEFPHGLEKHLIVDGRPGDLLAQAASYRLSGYITQWNTKNRLKWLVAGYSHPTFTVGSALIISLFLLRSLCVVVILMTLWVVIYYHLAKIATQARLMRSDKPMWEMTKPFVGDAMDTIVPIIGLVMLVSALLKIRRRYYPNMQAQPDTPYSYVREDTSIPAIGKAQTMTHDHVANVVTTNLATIVVEGEKGKWAVNIVGIKNTLWLCPRHVFSAHGDLDVYNIRAWRRGASQRPLTQLHRDSISPVGVKDMVLINLPDLGMVKDISCLLPLSEPRGSRLCLLLHSSGGEMSQHKVKVDTVNVALDKPKEYNWVGARAQGRRQVYNIANNTTGPGSCGSPMISLAGREKTLIGFHVMRLARLNPYDRCGLETVTLKEFQKAEQQMSKRGEVTGTPMMLEMRTVEGLAQVERGAIHPRHSLNHVAHPDETAILGFWHARSTPVSKVKPSLISSDVEKAFSIRANMFGPPPFRYFEDGTPNWPYTVGLEQITHRGAHYVMEAVPSIREMLLKQFSQDLKEIRVLTDQEIQDGLRDKSVNPLNMRSSAGHPYNKEKRKMSSDKEPPYRLHASAWEALARFEKSIESGRVEIQLFKATLKDEPVLTGQKKKARLFQASSLTLTLWIRKHLGWLCSHMARYNLNLGVAIGMDCQGERWHEMIKEFDTGECDIIQYDYKKFDQHVSPAMKAEVVRFVCTLMERNGADAKWVSHVRKGLSQWIFPSTVFDGVILQLRNSNPSGIGVTTAFNCIDNMYRSFGAVYLITKRLDFQSFCKIMTYGDDAFLRCEDQGVTLQTMAHAFEQMGMVITPTQKDMALEEAPGRIYLKDLDFLSRRSVWHEALGRYLGALQDESLFKGLLVQHSDISPEEHAAAASGSALYEAFARGEEFYDDFRMKLGSILAARGLDATVDWHMSYRERAEKRKKTNEGAVEYTPSVEARDLREHPRTGVFCQPCFDDAVPLGPLLLSNLVSVLGPDNPSPYQAILESGYHSRPTSYNNNNNTGMTTVNENLGQTMFHMDRPDHEAMMNHNYDVSRDSAFTSQMQLADWFERPVQIREFTWPNAGFAEVFDPWTAYMNNATIRQKMEGYAWFSGTLHVKFVVTGQQFVFGRAVVGYDPYPVGGRLNRIPLPAAGDEQMRITQISQRQHLYLNPTTNTGGQFVCPFFFPQDMCPLRANSITNLGRMHIQSIVSLQSVRDTPPKATITVYAWMPDLKLAGPTTTPVLQAEVQDTKLSAKLSVVSRVASMLSATPVIGPYATAAAVFARNAANVALHLGFSRPESMGATTRYWPAEGEPMAHAVGEVANTALAFDPKCTTVIDPMVTGLESKDEMVLQYLRERESYFSVFTWPEAAAQGSLLASYKISPTWTTGNGTGTICPTSLAYATYPFDYWRGTIKMRFQIVAAAVHTGMLRFVYDVDSNSTGLLDVAEQNKLRVLNVDISRERDITLEFPYMQFQPYLTVAPFHTNDLTLPENFVNGIVRIYVMNSLVSSAESAPTVEVIVSISAGSDFEAWNPADRYAIHQPVLEAGEVPQIGTELSDSAPEAEQSTAMLDTYTMPQHTGIFYADPILSIRYLLKRFYLTSYTDGSQTGGQNYLLIQNVKPNNTASSGPLEAPRGPFQYWSAGYVGWRGSLNKRLLGAASNVSIGRRQLTGSQVATISVSTSTVHANTLALASATEFTQRGVINVNFPWYKPSRFNVSCLEPNFTTPEAERYQVGFTHFVQRPFMEFTSAGEDFMLLYYVGAPRLRTIA